MLSSLPTHNVPLSAGGRLDLVSDRFDALDLDACGGRVRVSGEVRALDDRTRVRDVLFDAPGVEEVFVDELRVSRPESPRATAELIAARTDELLGATPRWPERSAKSGPKRGSPSADVTPFARAATAAP